jgi:uncharacterized OB-fold protein
VIDPGGWYLPAGLPGPQARAEGVAAPFWEAARREELVVQRCRTCGRFQWTPEWICHRCHGFDLAFEVVVPEGEIVSWERVWQPVHPVLAEACPYVVVVVGLPQADGVRMVGNLLGDPQVLVEIGAAVEAAFEHHGEFTLVQWRRPS